MWYQQKISWRIAILNCWRLPGGWCLFIPLSKTWSSGPGQRYLALPWDKPNSGFRCQVSGVSKSKS
ncbi:hypothetical protein D1AOALGA4SA_3146 [Olavius algarvensis Delta 1 endosymbiont]|nr:hypothetical protein D1AOALGA4SA_3146 [Olavius algarvensis Delta 1 endosymbiont]